MYLNRVVSELLTSYFELLITISLQLPNPVNNFSFLNHKFIQIPLMLIRKYYF
jgi:hypothetical protein